MLTFSQDLRLAVWRRIQNQITGQPPYPMQTLRSE